MNVKHKKEDPDAAPENVDLIITHDFNDIAVATRNGNDWDSFGWRQRKPAGWILMPERKAKRPGITPAPVSGL